MNPSLWFFLPESEYIELELRSVERQGAHEVGVRALGGQARPPPSWTGCGPHLVFIFGEDFLLFFLRCSVEFQDILRIFVFCT